MASSYDCCMREKTRLSATVDAELITVAQQAVRKGAADSVSAWVNDALRQKAAQERRLAALDVFLADWEAEHGEITDADIVAAQRRARERAIVVRPPVARRTRGA